MRKRILAIFMVLTLLIPAAGAVSVDTDTQMRGVWVSSVYNLDYPSAQTTNAATLMAEADTILDNCAALGFNAVFLQVRPSSDALYASSIFPWSRYLTGTQGVSPSNGFDPLAYWVSGAHARGMELHAWLNPYRITKNGDSEWETLSADNPAKQHPEWVVKYEDNYYFDPALPEVRELVVNGALEIVRGYDVDGVHLDDYFYPGSDFDDSASYARYGAGWSDLGDWRRDNVNQLVAALDSSLHSADPSISFGISPAGIWDNAPGNPRGSATKGRSSYSQIYCDSLYWIESGIVDYICPQVYWNIGFEAADFSILLDWWADAVSGTDVKLYIGMAAYRSAEAADASSVWYGSSEIERQLSLIDSTGKANGSVQFRYGSIAGSAALSTAIQNRFAGVPSPIVPQQPAAPQTGTSEAGSLLDIFSLFLYSIAH